jgi:hypothetical protein
VSAPMISAMSHLVRIIMETSNRRDTRTAR